MFRFAWLYLTIDFPRAILQNYIWLYPTLFKISPAFSVTQPFLKCHFYCWIFLKMLSPHIIAINCIILAPHVMELLRFKNNLGKHQYLFEQTTYHKILNKRPVSFESLHSTSARRKLQNFNKYSFLLNAPTHWPCKGKLI